MFKKPVMLTICLISAALGAETALPPLDMVPPEDLSPNIEWKEDLRKTRAHNLDRWKDELESVPNKAERARRLHARDLALVRAAQEKWPETKDDPDLALLVADRLGDIGAPLHRVAQLQTAIESHPGDFVTAAKALEKMLPGSAGAAMSLPPGTIEYAVDHLAALERGGYFQPGDPAVGNAYLVLAEMRRQQDRLAEAAEALRQAEARLGRSRDVLWCEARLAVDLGLADQASAAYEEIQRAADNSREVDHARDEMSRQLASLTPPGPLPSVPVDPGLDGRWDALRDAGVPPDEATIMRLLDDPDAIHAVVETGGTRYRSLWSAVVTLLEERYPDRVVALAAAREPQASAVVKLASTNAELLAAHRQFPWSESVHRAMLAAGERALWQGDYGGALRWFEDVLTRARVPELRRHAAVGRWLAISQQGDTAALDAVLAEGLDPAATYPWRGGDIRGGELADLLRKAAAAATPTANAAARTDLTVVPVPAVEAWAPMMAGGSVRQRAAAPYIAPQPTVTPDGRMFVAGPSYVAAFDAEAKPIWARVNTVYDGVPGELDNLIVPPSPMQAVVSDGVVIVRGSPDDETGAPGAMMGFDADSGTPLWSSEGNVGWDRLVPVSDMTVSDGWGYVVAINDGILATAHVLAVDPATGAVRWKRALAAQTPSITIDGNKAMNLARYGHAPTVAGGALYVSTNLGIVARLDVRDGSIDWMSLYPRTSVGRSGFPLLRRRGAPPTVAGNRVVVVSRDHQGAFALDADTGALAWENVTAPTHGVAGHASGAIFVFDDHSLAAIDIVTGDVRWRYSLDHALTLVPQFADGVLHLLDGQSIQRIDASTGLDLAPRPLPGATPASWNLSARGITAVTRTPAGTAALEEPFVHTTGQSILPRTSPLVILPPEGAGNALLVRSSDLLEAVEVSEQPRVRWRRRLPSASAKIVWLRDSLLILSEQGAELVRLSDGVTSWHATLPGGVTHAAASDAGIAIASAGREPAAPLIAMLEPATGRTRWQRPLLEHGDPTELSALAFHEGRLITVGRNGNSSPPRRFVLDPQTGAVVQSQRLIEEDSRHVKDLGIVEGRAWVLLGNGTLYVVAPPVLSQEPPAGLPESQSTKLDDLYQYGSTGIWSSPDGTALFVVQRSWDWRVDHVREKTWLVHLDAPSKVLRPTSTDLAVFGQKIAAIEGDKASIQSLGSASGAVPLTVPGIEGVKTRPLATAVSPDNDRVALLSEVIIEESQAYTRRHVRVDIFDAARGTHVANVILKNAAIGDAIATMTAGGEPTSEHRVIWYGNSLIVTGRDSVRIVPIPGAKATPAEDLLVAHRAEPIALDGDLSEWADVPPLQLSGGGGGTLRMVHDGENLLLAVSHAQPQPAPLLGEGRGSVGSWLEIGNAPHRWTDRRFGVGVDPRGQPVWFGLDSHGVPENVKAAIRFDPEAKELHYELSIPLQHIARGQGRGWMPMGLSIAAWKEGVSQAPPARAVSGAGLDRPALYTPALRTVRLEPRPK